MSNTIKQNGARIPIVYVANMSGGGSGGSTPTAGAATSALQTELQDEVVKLTGSQSVACTYTKTTATGNISGSNLIEASITNVGTANGTVFGTSLLPGDSLTFRVIDRMQLLSPIEFNATGTEFAITTMFSTNTVNS